ncbi:uncharacterized protein LOC111127866 isoform X2 [Crassostrea virginica]
MKVFIVLTAFIIGATCQQQMAAMQPQVQYAQVQYYQPVSYGTVGGTGGTGGSGLFDSGNLSGGGGSGSILPLILIFVLLAVFAPVLIGSLASSNTAVFNSTNSMS